jgi:hypothetical protein
MRIPQVSRTPYASAISPVGDDGGGANGGPFDEGAPQRREPPVSDEVPHDVVEESSAAGKAVVETSPVKLRALELIAPLQLTREDWNAEGIEPWEERSSVKTRARVVVAEVTGKPWRSPFQDLGPDEQPETDIEPGDSTP